MVGSKNWKIISIVSIFILIVIYFLDTYITDTEEVLYERLEKSVINDMSNIGENIDRLFRERLLQEEDKNLFEYLKTKAELRENLEQQLSLFITSKIKYLYIIYKDEKEKFRFLLDGSIEDKARFNQKFDVEDPHYYTLYETKKEYAIKQKSFENLSITFLHPVIIEDKVEAIIVFDFSSAFEYELKKIVAPLKTMFMLIYIIISVFLLVTFIQTILYYKARNRSYIDELTGCYNRQYLRYFLDKHDINNYQVLMIDFDYFKKVNDNYGHEVGDKVLIFGAKHIQCSLTNEDKCFRYGGEEFIVLVHKQDEGGETAELIRSSIENSCFSYEKIKINITVSIGLNPIPQRARNKSQAINIADSMLYKAKIKGRNRVVAYTEGMDVNIEEIHSNSNNIHHVVKALAEDRIVCHFHKIINAKNEVHKYESLVRYLDKNGDLMYPNHFLSDIMHTNVYTDLTKRVIDISLKEMELQEINISINLNINDLFNKPLIEYLSQKVTAIKDKSYALCIEILENEEIKNIEELYTVIEKLHNLGVKFSIDDFGSGYANFNYLVKLDVDYIKIDGSLVENILNSEKSKHIVKSIIDLAHSMGMKTIAEFVSSKEIHDVMLELDTDYMQGFYIAKPQAKI